MKIAILFHNWPHAPSRSPSTGYVTLTRAVFQRLGAALRSLVFVSTLVLCQQPHQPCVSGARLSAQRKQVGNLRGVYVSRTCGRACAHFRASSCTVEIRIVRREHLHLRDTDGRGQFVRGWRVEEQVHFHLCRVLMCFPTLRKHPFFGKVTTMPPKSSSNTLLSWRLMDDVADS